MVHSRCCELQQKDKHTTKKLLNGRWMFVNLCARCFAGRQYCCAALCLVAQDVRNCVLIINEGAIPHMLAGAKDGDMVTKQSCCAVLSTLSSKARVCPYGNQ